MKLADIDEVNKRRTKSENVSVAFVSPEEGETRGLFVADAETYGADKLWVVVEVIPIDVDDDDGSSPHDSDSDS